MDTSALKHVVKSLSDVLLLVSDATQSVSFDLVLKAFGVLKDVPTLVADLPKIAPQWEDLDEVEKKDLYAYIQTTVSFPANTNVEVWVEKVLKLGVALSEAFVILAK